MRQPVGVYFGDYISEDDPMKKISNTIRSCFHSQAEIEKAHYPKGTPNQNRLTDNQMNLL